MKRIGSVVPSAVAVVVGLANVAVLAVKLPGILSVLYLNSDTSSAPVIASLMASAPPTRVVTLGNYSWYEALWFMQATRGLPNHRAIWEVAPIAGTLAAFVLLVWMIWKVAGRTSALIVAALVVSIAPFEQSVLFTLDTHGLLLLHACALLAALVFFETRRVAPSWWSMGLLAVPLSAFTAVGIASDPLSIATLVVPFLAATLAVSRRFRTRRQRRIGIFSATTILLAIVSGELLAASMRASHVAPTRLLVSLVSGGTLANNFVVFAKAFTNLGGGDFFDSSTPRTLAVAVGLLIFAGLLLAISALVCWAVRARRPSSADGAAPGAPAFIVFWGTTLLCTSAVFILSSVPQDAHSGRYLMNAFIGVVALIPIVASRSKPTGRLLIGIGAAAFATLTLAGSIREPSSPSVAVSPIAPPIAGQIERFVLAHGASTGYATYWDAEALTWATQLRIQAYPAYSCALPNPVICPFVLNTISSWYVPEHRGSTFLIADTTEPDPLTVNPHSPSPIATATFGSVTVHIYDFDLARTIRH